MAKDMVISEKLLRQQPLFVIEFSSMSEKEIYECARKKKLAAATMKRIKHQEICVERYKISKPKIYVLHPSLVQVSSIIVIRQRMLRRFLICLR